KQAFNFFDRDKSGAIDFEELGNVMDSLGIKASESEMRAMIANIDVDQTGTVDFDEFYAMSCKGHVGTFESEEELREAFQLMDVDGSGFITPGDLVQVLQGLGEPTENKHLLEMVRLADADGDGQVGYDDFKRMMNSKV
ncbi:calmodulin, partial [Blyttiomyces helicus]